MLTKVIRVGDKINLVKSNTAVNNQEEKKIYKSQVYDVVGEEQLKIAMPQEKGRLLLLELDGVYRLQFFSESGLYECKGKVVDRYKTDNVYLVVVDIVSALKKIQRREFYRLNCLLDGQIHILDDAELMAGDIKRILRMHELNRSVYEKAVILDISGGGARVVTDCQVAEDSYITMKFQVDLKNNFQEFELLAHVVTAKRLENQKESYELRIEFEQIDNNVRESLIKYIFEEDRKKRKSEKS